MKIGIQDVTKRFDAFVALDRVNLDIHSGELVALLGPSGSGKTTLLRIMAGLDWPDSGSVWFGGENALALGAAERHVGFVFQHYALFRHMTVFENVAFGLRARPRDQRPGEPAIRKRVGDLLDLVQLSWTAQRYPDQLSGGQRQRIALARALAVEPRVLLLDEPLSNLDARLRTQTGDEFRALQKRLGITSLYVTHDQGEAMALSDRIVVMHSGHILQIGSPEEIYRRPASKGVAGFFGSPNFLPSKVKTCAPQADGAFQLALDGPGWVGPCGCSSALPEGADVLVMVRPENMRIADKASIGAGEMSWTGPIVQSIFRGTHRSIVVETPAGRLNIDVPSVNNPALGSTITLAADSTAVWATPA